MSAFCRGKCDVVVYAFCVSVGPVLSGECVLACLHNAHARAVCELASWPYHVVIGACMFDFACVKRGGMYGGSVSVCLSVSKVGNVACCTLLKTFRIFSKFPALSVKSLSCIGIIYD